MPKAALALIITLCLSLFLLATITKASEGRISLTNGPVKCEGVSIWDDGYKVTGRCQGLTYPFSEGFSNYSLWAKLADGKIDKIDTLDEGVFNGSTDQSFGSIFITAENESGTLEPQGTVIVSGDINKFDFTVVPSATLKPIEPISTPEATPVSLQSQFSLTPAKLWPAAVFLIIIVVIVILIRR